ncbi:MAG: efflux RND transporter periplasmic adaptor subunit [Acetobacteraceae bacterium]|nr:efflux RND transporter periplasmic adaptor subunit [Acetobacteraceae bacterium]
MRPSHMLLLVLPLALGGCFERAEATVDHPVRPVLATVVQPAQEEAPRRYPGVIRPRREADVGFRAAGRIVAREVDVGARVTAGQALARLDDADIALGVRAAEADLASAEAQAALATAEAGRSRTLAAGGWASAAADDQRQAAARSAKQRVLAARAARALARNRLEHAVLRAPVDGVVTAVLADRGTVVDEGQPVLRLADARGLEVEVQLPETALGDARRAAAEVSLWADPDATIPAHLRELAAAATPGLRLYAARFTLAAPPAWLAIGMSATVSLRATVPEGLASVPAAALVDRGQGAMVWVIAGDAVVARPVQIMSLGRDHAVVSGVAPGATIVALGGHKLDPAARVRIARLGD